MRCDHSLRQHPNERFRPSRRNVRPGASYHEIILIEVIVRRIFARRQSQRDPHFGTPGPVEIRPHHADDAIVLVIQLDTLAEDRRVASKQVLPRAVREDGNLIGMGLVLFWLEYSARSGRAPKTLNHSQVIFVLPSSAAAHPGRDNVRPSSFSAAVEEKISLLFRTSAKSGAEMTMLFRFSVSYFTRMANTCADPRSRQGAGIDPLMALKITVLARFPAPASPPPRL